MRIMFYKLYGTRPPITISYVNVTDENEIVWGYNSKIVKDKLLELGIDIDDPDKIRELPKILTGGVLFAAVSVSE